MIALWEVKKTCPVGLLKQPRPSDWPTTFSTTILVCTSTGQGCSVPATSAPYKSCYSVSTNQRARVAVLYCLADETAALATAVGLEMTAALDNYVCQGKAVQVEAHQVDPGLKGTWLSTFHPVESTSLSKVLVSDVVNLHPCMECEQKQSMQGEMELVDALSDVKVRLTATGSCDWSTLYTVQKSASGGQSQGSFTLKKLSPTCRFSPL